MLSEHTPPSAHRLAVLGSVWLASVGQWRLWHALGHLPELADGRTLAFMASTLVLLAALCTAVLSLLVAWPRTIRPVLSLVLLGNAWAMLGAPRPLEMPATTWLLLLAGTPLAWLWSRPVLPMADSWTQLLHNLGTALAATGVAVAAMILSVADFSWMWLQHPELVELLGPVRLWRLLPEVQREILQALSGRFP